MGMVRTKKSLNAELRKEDFHIPENKTSPNALKAYEFILKKWKRKSDIISSAKQDAAFKLFIDSLKSIEPIKTEDFPAVN